MLNCSRAWHWLHVSPRSALVTCFPALGTGHMFSRAWHWFHVFPRLVLVTKHWRVPALGTGYMLSLLFTKTYQPNRTAGFKTFHKRYTWTSWSSPLSLKTFVLKEEVSAGIPWKSTLTYGSIICKRKLKLNLFVFITDFSPSWSQIASSRWKINLSFLRWHLKGV